MASKIDDLYKIRHSAAHVMAQAVLELYPEAKFAIGPPIENGFYYDFDLGVAQDGSPRTFRPEDLKAIEKRMRQIISGKHQFCLSRGQRGRSPPALRRPALQIRAD